MSCPYCDLPDYEAMLETAKKWSKSGSVLERYWAQRAYRWVEGQIKPSILEKIEQNPLHGRVVRWKIGEGE